MMNPALGYHSQSGGSGDGKTEALRGERQVKQRLAEAVDD
jgi:hypothetical protein